MAPHFSAATLLLWPAPSPAARRCRCGERWQLTRRPPPAPGRSRRELPRRWRLGRTRIAVATARRGRNGGTAESQRPDFIISLGDNFYSKGVASVTDSHWQESFENVYSGA